MPFPPPNLNAPVRGRRVNGAVAVNGNGINSVLMRLNGLQTPVTQQVPHLKASIPRNRIHKPLVNRQTRNGVRMFDPEPRLVASYGNVVSGYYAAAQAVRYGGEGGEETVSF